PWWCQAVSGQDTFYFSPQPADVRVRQGESATLRCGVSKSDRISFYWTLGGEAVRNTTRRFQQGSDLRVTRVDPSLDLGEFKCIATNASTGYSLASQGAQLNVLSDLDSSETSGAPGAMGEGGSGALSNKSSEKGGSEQTRQNHGSLLVPNLRYWLSDMWRQPR
ncbi:inactive tyrosine-protein kinase 7, partial [Ixodes scapularis]